MFRLSARFMIISLSVLFSVLIWVFIIDRTELSISTGRDSFTFQNDSISFGKSVTVYTYKSASANSESPILILIHGTERNAVEFQDEWIKTAEKYHAVLVTPHFSKKEFKYDYQFHYGNVLNMDPLDTLNGINDEMNWTFSFIDPIFLKVKQALKNKSNGYFLYGHSAGGQFVHRMMYFKPNSFAEKIIVANAGWYTLPNFNVRFPYGLKSTPISQEALEVAFSKKITILLGTNDTDQFHFQLKHSPEIDKQGITRFERGLNYYYYCKRLADSMDIPFKWQVKLAPGIEHQNDRMAYFAGLILFGEDISAEDSLH